jgi:nucleotide sugar dehydrogenase
MMSVTISKTIKNHKKTIAIYGLGNVGGAIAACWLRAGAKVIGVDISKKLLSDIKTGKSHSKEPFVTDIFSKSLKSGNFILTDDGVKASKNSDIKIIVVPVGLKKNKSDLKYVISASQTISKGLKKGDVVVLSPSVPPGTTENIVLPILEKQSKLKAERDFFLIYNPERIFEGRAIQDIEENYPAIVAGLGPKSLDFGNNLLKIISKKGVMKMSNLATAEAEKLFEGVFRDVNIALANQLSDYCEKIGINFWDARKAANSQPFCHLHFPGTGVGGLCIPVYPRIIIESANKIGKSMKLLEFSRRINDEMPKKCVKESISLLKQNRKVPKGKQIAVLGLGFRGEVTDKRLSPTYSVVDEFLKFGCSVSVHDPYIKEDDELPKEIHLSNNLSSVVNNADLIFISTDHKKYSNLSKSDFKNTKKPLLIYDGRNILQKNLFDNMNLLTIGNYT